MQDKLERELNYVVVAIREFLEISELTVISVSPDNAKHYGDALQRLKDVVERYE